MIICNKVLMSGPKKGSPCGRVLVNCECRYHGKQLTRNFGSVLNGETKQIKQEQKKDTCSICFEEVAMYNFKKYNGIHIMSCGHKMHGNCYSSFLMKCEQSAYCPFCKRKQFEFNYQTKVIKLHKEIRNLNETLANVQRSLTEESENCHFWTQRYQKWKYKYKDLLGDYNIVLANYQNMQNMNNINRTMIYNLQILNSELTNKVRDLIQELNEISDSE